MKRDDDDGWNGAGTFRDGPSGLKIEDPLRRGWSGQVNSFTCTAIDGGFYFILFYFFFGDNSWRWWVLGLLHWCYSPVSASSIILASTLLVTLQCSHRYIGSLGHAHSYWNSLGATRPTRQITNRINTLSNYCRNNIQQNKTINTNSRSTNKHSLPLLQLRITSFPPRRK